MGLLKTQNDFLKVFFSFHLGLLFKTYIFVLSSIQGALYKEGIIPKLEVEGFIKSLKNCKGTILVGCSEA